eukprot:357081-Chlamydomonas_euryale.AAC.2
MSARGGRRGGRGAPASVSMRRGRGGRRGARRAVRASAPACGMRVAQRRMGAETECSGSGMGMLRRSSGRLDDTGPWFPRGAAWGVVTWLCLARCKCTACLTVNAATTRVQP